MSKALSVVLFFKNIFRFSLLIRHIHYLSMCQLLSHFLLRFWLWEAALAPQRGRGPHIAHTFTYLHISNGGSEGMETTGAVSRNNTLGLTRILQQYQTMFQHIRSVHSYISQTDFCLFTCSRLGSLTACGRHYNASDLRRPLSPSSLFLAHARGREPSCVSVFQLPHKRSFKVPRLISCKEPKARRSAEVRRTLGLP